MALFPCSLCGKRYRGASQTLYPTVLYTSDRMSAHLRLCQECFDEVLEQLTAHAVQLAFEPQDDLEVKLCTACGAPSGGTRDYTVYVTVFRRGDEREDFLGAVHPDCADSLIDTWRLKIAA